MATFKWPPVDTSSTIVGKDLTDQNLLVGDVTNAAAEVDTSAVGDILADELTGLTYKAGSIVNEDVDSAAKIEATKIADGSVTDAEFQYINSLTSNAQDQIDSKQADVITTRGDLVVGNAAPTAARLGLGAAGKYLRSDGTDVAWEDLESDPTFNSVLFNTSPTVASPVVGQAWWNATDKTLNLKTTADTTLQIGQELTLNVCNNSGEDIINGEAIYISGVDTGCPEITHANAADYDESRLIGIATQDIDNGEEGLVTRFGLVRDIDTSGVATGIIYLDTTDGALTNTRPTGGSFLITVGTCLVSDGALGIILVDPKSSELSVEVTDTNGFPSSQRSNTTLSFVDGSRTLTITPATANFHYYEDGTKYTHVGADDLIIDDTEGNHIVYYDEGVLKSAVNPSDVVLSLLIRTKPLVCYVYWNFDAKTHTFIDDERHGISMSPQTHTYLHYTRGCQFLTGLGLGDFTIGSGSLADHAQFSAAGGLIADEDLTSSPDAVAVGVGLPIYYLSGAAGNLRRVTKAGFSMIDDTTSSATTTTGRIVWNENTGSTWQLTVVPDNDYVLCHIFATPGIDGEDQIIAVVGQASYASAAAAEAGASAEVTNIITGFNIAESVIVGSVIFNTKNTYGNAIKSKIVQTSESQNYIDWRVSELAQGAAAASHQNLTNLLLAADGVAWGHIDDQAQSIFGAKTLNDQLTLSSGVIDSTLTANRAVVSDASKQLVSSVTTDTEVSYLNGVTSAIQDQIDSKQANIAASTDNILARYHGTDNVQGTGIAVDDSDNMSGIGTIGSGALTSTGTSTFGVIQNTDIDGTSMSNTNRIALPKGTFATLDGLTDKEALIAYATDEEKVYFNTGSGWAVIGGGLIPVQIDHTYAVDLVAGNHYLLDMSGATANVVLNLEAGAAESVISVTVYGMSLQTAYATTPYFAVVTPDGTDTLWMDEEEVDTGVLGDVASTVRLSFQDNDDQWLSDVSDLFTSRDLSGDWYLDGRLGIGTSDVSGFYRTTNAGSDVSVVMAVLTEDETSGLAIDSPNGSTTDIYFTAENSAGNRIGGARIRSGMTSSTAGAETVQLQFATKDSAGALEDRMTISADGNVGIGAAPNTRTLNVGGWIEATGNIYTTGKGAFLDSYTTTTGAGANVYIASDGYLYRSTSSLKYKSDVVDYSKGLEAVIKMRPVSYKSKDSKDDKTYAGFIAEEIHDLGLSEFVQYADDNTPDALSYGNMTTILTKAIQELNTKHENEIAELKSEIAILKGE